MEDIYVESEKKVKMSLEESGGDDIERLPVKKRSLEESGGERPGKKMTSIPLEILDGSSKFGSDVLPKILLPGAKVRVEAEVTVDDRPYIKQYHKNKPKIPFRGRGRGLAIHLKEEKEKCLKELEEGRKLKESDFKDDISDFEDEIELKESDMPEYNEYVRQMVSSGGFDIERCPPLYPCLLYPLTNLEEGSEEYKHLCHFSRVAINKFNRGRATRYLFVKFVKAVSTPCAGTKYYITFEAKELFDGADAPTVFQALVYHGIPRKFSRGHVVRPIKVLLVRKKSEATPEDNKILLC